jgi:hypothetical protein
MEALATANVSSSELPVAVLASMHFASEIGAAQTEIERSETVQEELISRLIIEAKTVIASWQNFLNVEGSHSKDSLLAVFSLVSAGVKLFEAVCRLQEQKQVISKSMRDELSDILADIEDIQEILAILIDDEARAELQSILNEAGLQALVLEQVDGDSRRPAQTTD